ncbi:MAG: FtsQ-type POTRA domain-containing protein [Gammaproteobacteria bacterium]
MIRFSKQGTQAKRNLTEQLDEFQWRRSYSWVLLLLPLVSSGVYLSQQGTFFPIRTIQLSGTFQYIDQQEVESTLQAFIGESFFSLDIQQVQQTISDKSWADSVSIRRIWPDRLNIRIVEKIPVARWDSEHLISHKAAVYHANTDAFRQLPLVHAVNSSPEKILYRYYQLATRFDALNEKLVSVAMDSRGALDIELASGLKIKVGRDDIDRKVERLVTIYQQQIQPRRDEIELLDLRYSNGFAVAWKKEVLRDRSEASLWRNTNV